MAKKPTVAVDLDGVLASYDGWRGIEHIGEPIEGAREFLEMLRVVAHVQIFTTRTADFNAAPGEDPVNLVAPVRMWLQKHQLPYDEIYQGSGKPLAAAIVDDRGVSCRPQEGPSPQLKFMHALEDVIELLPATAWGQAQQEAAAKQQAPGDASEA